MKKVISLLLLTLAAALTAEAQEVSKSRAEIANQRIAAEVEIRRRAEEAAREEELQRRAEAAAQQERANSQTALQNSEPQPEPSPARSRADLSMTLQQLRTLGELRDAGYVTEDEFDRIKMRILDAEL